MYSFKQRRSIYVRLSAFGHKGLQRLTYLKQWKDRERSRDSLKRL